MARKEVKEGTDVPEHDGFEDKIQIPVVQIVIKWIFKYLCLVFSQSKIHSGAILTTVTHFVDR